MLRDKIKSDLTTAMKAGDSNRVRTIRSLMAAMMEKEIELRQTGNPEITDDLAVDVIMKAAKQRRDAQQQYADNNRQDLADIEAAELTILEEYLPAQLSDEDIRTGVEEIVQQTGAASMKDMGKVMGVAMKRFKGQADGKRVQMAVRAVLSGS
ncbi:MAG: GatB/YqeY domain-containing protein [Rhodothermales bacterium]|nr:GatB/YqeY domain-containing protein [Rhodothermales bacterium]MBO6781448.1 GatB/YqeY domain-containing protein [Rhodothermales bacterium]